MKQMTLNLVKSYSSELLACSVDPVPLLWTRSDSSVVIYGNVTKPMNFWYSYSENKCFSVSSDDLLSPQDVHTHWKLVEEADKEEIKSFIHHKVFAHRYKSEVGKANVLDATWVRKWKLKDGK